MYPPWYPLYAAYAANPVWTALGGSVVIHFPTLEVLRYLPSRAASFRITFALRNLSSREGINLLKPLCFCVCVFLKLEP